jgi:hypothetical protein
MRNSLLAADPAGLALEATVTQGVTYRRLRFVSLLVLPAPFSRDSQVLFYAVRQARALLIVIANLLKARSARHFNRRFVTLLASRSDTSIELAFFPALPTNSHG